MSGVAHILRMENVTVRYDGVPALDRMNFSLDAGETCVILGAAGSGKTVFLKTALGLIEPDEGRVDVMGKDTTGFRERDWVELRAHMGMLFQEGGLFDSLTIEENVGYPLVNIKSIAQPPEEVHRRVQEVLDFVELGHTLDKVPSELSGGMRRRVGIARVLVTNPTLTLFDSPTAGLDPITANTIMALIAKSRDTHNTSNVIVTHRIQDGDLLSRYRYDVATGELVAATSDTRTRFMVLNEGRIAFEGSQDELDASHDPYVAKFARRWKE
jgi:phospholipid/cholesterol/gamma-HCH transport system ATP-binding protein